MLRVKTIQPNFSTWLNTKFLLTDAFLCPFCDVFLMRHCMRSTFGQFYQKIIYYFDDRPKIKGSSFRDI